MANDAKNQDTKSEIKKDLTDLFKVNESENDSASGAGMDMDLGELASSDVPQEFAEFTEEPVIEQIDSFEDMEMLPELEAGTEPASESFSLPDSGSENPAVESGSELSSELLPELSPEPVTENSPELAGEASTATDQEKSRTQILPPVQDRAPGITQGSTPAAAAPAGLAQVKEYAETMIPSPVVASIPYSVMIEGRLNVTEREKLLDLLSSQNMGIREMDMEPQFQAGKILLPRISEYAAVIIVQALRSAHVRIRMFPSPEHLSEESGVERSDLLTGTSSSPIRSNISLDSGLETTHPAELIPITPSSTFPQYKKFFVVDTVSSSATLKSNAIEVQSTTQFQEVLESLQKEIKYKAYRKGASAIIGFTVTVTPLHLPSHYRMLVMGTAIHQN